LLAAAASLLALTEEPRGGSDTGTPTADPLVRVEMPAEEGWG
jgi:anti-sigma-K factor RskA